MTSLYNKDIKYWEQEEGDLPISRERTSKIEETEEKNLIPETRTFIPFDNKKRIETDVTKNISTSLKSCDMDNSTVDNQDYYPHIMSNTKIYGIVERIDGDYAIVTFNVNNNKVIRKVKTSYFIGQGKKKLLLGDVLCLCSTKLGTRFISEMQFVGNGIIKPDEDKLDELDRLYKDVTGLNK